jgi:hypothetical protein
MFLKEKHPFFAKKNHPFDTPSIPNYKAFQES